MVKKTFQAYESLNSDVRAWIQAQLTILGRDEQEIDVKKRSSRNSASDHMKPLEMVKKTFQTFESLNSDVRAWSQAQLTILGQEEQETDAKNRTSRNLASEITNPLQMEKKTYMAFESLNSDVRPRSQAQNTILGQDEQETDTKNRTLRNSASEATNPLQIQLLITRTPQKW